MDKQQLTQHLLALSDANFLEFWKQFSRNVAPILKKIPIIITATFLALLHKRL